MCVTVHHLIEVSLLIVFWQVEGTNVGPLIIGIKMLDVCVTLTCIVCVCMYNGQNPMPGEAQWMSGEAHCMYGMWYFRDTY